MTREEAGALHWDPIRRPAPLFFQSFFAGSGLLLAWLFPQGFLLVLTACAVGLILSVARKYSIAWRWGFGLALFFFIYGNHTYHHVSEQDLRRLDVPLPRTVQLKLIPLEEPEWKSGAYDELNGKAVCRVTAVNLGTGWQAAEGEVWTRIKGKPGQQKFYGYEATVGGYLEIPLPPEGPGQFDFSAYLKSSGIHHLFTAHLDDWEATGEFCGWSLLQWANHLRFYMVDVLQLGLDPASPWPSLIAGMLFGYRDGISAEMMNEFTVTGTLHLFAVSGQNVGMILWVFLIFLRSFGLIKWRWGWMVAPGLLMFCLSTGLESSASRALVMILLVLVGWLAYRPVTPLNLLGAAALILWVWDPWQLLDVGFQLSFLVLLALLVGTGYVARRLYLLARPDVFISRERLPQWRLVLDSVSAKGCMLIAASTVAWLASLPLILYHFGLISPITVLSNCLVVPLAGGVVVLALFAVLSSVVYHPLAACFNIINAKILMLMTTVIGALATVPGGHFYVSRDAALGDDSFKITILSGARNAPAILETKEQVVLIGTGTAREWKYQINPARQYLGHESFNSIISLQNNNRYLGSLQDIVSVVRTEHIYMAPYASLSPVFRDWQRYQAEHIAELPKVVRLFQRDIIWQSKLSSATVIWPERKDDNWSSENAGLCLQLKLDEVNIVWAGNPSEHVEKMIVGENQLIQTDILVQGAHSRESGLSFSWLKNLQPQVIVRSGAGFYPEQDMPLEKRQVIDEMLAELMELDNTGPIQIRGSRGAFRILYWNRNTKNFTDGK